MARVTNRPLTKPRDPNRFVDLIQFLAGALLLIAAGLLYASQRAELLVQRARISHLQEQLVRLQQEGQLLAVQLESELDPRRLERRARLLAGLSSPAPDRIALLPPGSSDPLRVWLAADGRDDGHR